MPNSNGRRVLRKGADVAVDDEKEEMRKALLKMAEDGGADV